MSDEQKAQLLPLLEKLSPMARRFTDDFMREVGFEEKEDLVYSAIVAVVLCEDDQQATELWQKISLVFPNSDERARLGKRVMAIRQFQLDGDRTVKTRSDLDRLLDARGVTDPQKREAVAQRIVKKMFEEGSEIIRLLEEEKQQYSGRADPRFPRLYAEKNPGMRTDARLRKGAEASLAPMRESDLFFEELRRRRPDLYRVHTWLIRAFDEAERIEVGLPPAEETTAGKEAERASRLLRIIDEREAAKAELIGRGLTPGSDDYERVINLFEVRIGRLMKGEG